MARGIFTVGVSEKPPFAYFYLLLTYSVAAQQIRHAAYIYLIALENFSEINDATNNPQPAA